MAGCDTSSWIIIGAAFALQPSNRRGDRESERLKRNTIIAVVLALLLFAVGFGAGRLVTTRELAAEAPATRIIAPSSLSDGAELPAIDVTGADIEGLPRYPGSVRVEYQNLIVGDFLETEVEYVVAAELGPVHDFYREVFKEEGWIVADIGIYQGEWTFFVVSGEREANVELEARQSLVEIEIELSEPLEESGVEPWSG